MTTLTTQGQWNREARYIEQLRAELAQAHDDLAQAQAEAAQLRVSLVTACAERDILNASELCSEIMTELVQAQAEAKKWSDEVNKLNKLLKERLDGWVDSAFDVVAERLGFLSATSLHDGIETLCKELAQALNERDEARDELSFAKQAAQEQSEEVQMHWLSPCQKAGLERQVGASRRRLNHVSALMAEAERELKARQRQIDLLAQGEKAEHQARRDAELRAERAGALAANTREAVRWLWGFYDGNTLVAKPGYEDDIREAWDRLLIAATDGKVTTDLLGRLEQAEALAQLVTPGLVALLERLATYANLYDAPQSSYDARELATHIREALDDKT